MAFFSAVSVRVRNTSKPFFGFMTGLYRFLSKYCNKKKSGYLPEKKKEKKKREKKLEKERKKQKKKENSETQETRPSRPIRCDGVDRRTNALPDRPTDQQTDRPTDGHSQL